MSFLYTFLPGRDFCFVIPYHTPLKFILFLEPDRLQSLHESEPVLAAARYLPEWLKWLWQHRYSGMEPLPRLKNLQETLEGMRHPAVLVLESEPKWKERLPLPPQGPCMYLIWNASGQAAPLTLLRGPLRYDWNDGFQDPQILKSIKAELKCLFQEARHLRQQSRLLAHRKAEIPLLDRFKTTVEQQYQDPKCTVPHLAKLCKTTPLQLQHLCREAFQIGPKAYLMQFRIKQACHLIDKTAGMRRCVMATVARQAGFNSASYFSAQFIKFTGVTPTEYLNRRLQGH